MARENWSNLGAINSIWSRQMFLDKYHTFLAYTYTVKANLLRSLSISKILHNGHKIWFVSNVNHAKHDLLCSYLWRPQDEDIWTHCITIYMCVCDMSSTPPLSKNLIWQHDGVNQTIWSGFVIFFMILKFKRSIVSE